MTIIKCGACDGISYGSQRESSPEVSYAMLKALQDHNHELKILKARGTGPSLDSLMLTRIKPFLVRLCKTPEASIYRCARHEERQSTGDGIGFGCEHAHGSLNEVCSDGQSLVRLKELYQKLHLSNCCGHHEA